ncbi:type II toxin-antitoxin system ParD family antitoxin [Methylobacterium sp. NFXW15]|uniref:type II toxin-antitoxin system ParD family antitoxin n=1 Tax=Methylobacterium sp. NFXW15 TaxID=2819512 RepID=UPI003CE8F21F
MATRLTVSVSLSPELHAVAERMLASGRYGNLSEVFRAALRLLDERERGFQLHCDTLSAPQSLRQTVTT